MLTIPDFVFRRPFASTMPVPAASNLMLSVYVTMYISTGGYGKVDVYKLNSIGNSNLLCVTVSFAFLKFDFLFTISTNDYRLRKYLARLHLVQFDNIESHCL